MKAQKGFTLIELMVVIVIIGILSALAIPRMIGVSAKAKAAEVPSVAANFETLQSAYVQETGGMGTGVQVGFADPTGDSQWWTYDATTTPGTLTATVNAGQDIDATCVAASVVSSTGALAGGDVNFTRDAGACAALLPNF